MRIRPMTPADSPLVADLTTQLGYPSSPEETTERLAALLERPDDNAVLVAEDEGRPVGWVHVELFRSLDSGLQANIGGLVVDESHRNHRIGAALLQAAEGWARDRGAPTMVVRSRVTRERAHRFYVREGYTMIKTSHVYEKPLVQ
jgi:GNAT superfamily N-acetyltransferase